MKLIKGTSIMTLTSIEKLRHKFPKIKDVSNISSDFTCPLPLSCRRFDNQFVKRKYYNYYDHGYDNGIFSKKTWA